MLSIDKIGVYLINDFYVFKKIILLGNKKKQLKIKQYLYVLIKDKYLKIIEGFWWFMFIVN